MCWWAGSGMIGKAVIAGLVQMQSIWEQCQKSKDHVPVDSTYLIGRLQLQGFCTCEAKCKKEQEPSDRNMSYRHCQHTTIRVQQGVKTS
jgi:hypothetical protein